MREALLQTPPELRAAAGPRVEVPAGVAPSTLVPGGGHQVGDETLVLALPPVGDHDARPHGQVLLDRGLYRPQLDAVAPDLDHEVRAAQDLEVAVRQDPRLVPGTVHASVFFGRKRIGGEALLRLLRQVDVPARQALAADEELASLPIWNLAPLFVQYVQPVRVHGTAHGTVRRMGAL